MNREPDWQALNQLNFLLAPRIGGALNEALNALSLAEMGNNGTDPQVWRDKAKAIIANLLNLYQAWTALIQYKNGFKLPPTVIRPFPVQALLDWLTIQLELVPPAKASQNFVLNGNQACIQEALWLLYTVGYTQGTGVHLLADPAENGYWFRIRFSRRKALPTSFDELIQSLGKHWRDEDAAFELKVARDFVEMNNGKLEIRWNPQHFMGEFAFFIYKAGANRAQAPGIAISPNVEHARYVANVSRSMMPVSMSAGDTTRILSAEETAKETTEAIGEAIETSEVKPAVAQEGENKTPAAESSDNNLKESAPAEASEAKAKDQPVARGTKLLQDLLEMDRQRKGGLVESEEDLPTAPYPVVNQLTTGEDKRTTQLGEPRIISVNLPEPETPALLKELNETTSIIKTIPESEAS